MQEVEAQQGWDKIATLLPPSGKDPNSCGKLLESREVVGSLGGTNTPSKRGQIQEAVQAGQCPTAFQVSDAEMMAPRIA